MTRPKRIAIAIAVLFGGMLLLGLAFVAVVTYLLRDVELLGSTETAEFATVEEWPGAESFEDQFELAFPASTRNIRLASGGFQEPIYQFRMTIDSADLAVLASSQGCNGLLSQPASRPPGALIEDLEWWTPDEAVTFQECAGSDAIGREQWVFVDQGDPDAFEVYIKVLYY